MKNIKHFIIASLVFQAKTHSMFDEVNRIRFSVAMYMVYLQYPVIHFHFTLLNSDYVPNKYQICVTDVLLSHFYCRILLLLIKVIIYLAKKK